MPTKNPRLTVTFEPAFMAKLKRLAELTGNSQSALLAELLQGATPVLDRLIALMEAAQEVRGELSAGLVADMEAAQSRVEGQLGLVLEDFDRVGGSLLEEAEQIKRRRTAASTMRKRGAGGRAAAPSTPMSNRGVRSSKSSPKAAS